MAQPVPAMQPTGASQAYGDPQLQAEAPAAQSNAYGAVGAGGYASNPVPAAASPYGSALGGAAAASAAAGGWGGAQAPAPQAQQYGAAQQQQQQQQQQPYGAAPAQQAQYGAAPQAQQQAQYGAAPQAQQQAQYGAAPQAQQQAQYGAAPQQPPMAQGMAPQGVASQGAAAPQAAFGAQQAPGQALPQPGGQGSPVHFGPGAQVLVQWSDGNRYPGMVQQVNGAQCLVSFPDGRQVWVDARYLSGAYY